MSQTPLDDCWRGLINTLAVHFGGHGVPSIKTAIEKAGNQAVNAVKKHPDYEVITSANIEILWVNPFVIPEIFFCLQDAADQKFDDYFSPIILTANPSEKGTIDTIHTTFHEYYKKDKDERVKGMVTLTDLNIGGIGELVIIHKGSASELDFSGYTERKNPFSKYVSLVTNNGQWEYGVFRAGLNGPGIEMGRVYVGYKNRNEDRTKISDETKKAIKRLCFDMLSAFVLAGVMQRNRIVLGMLGDFSRLMRTFDDHVIRHRDVLANLGMSPAETRRIEVKRLLDEMSGESAKWKLSGDYASHIVGCGTCKESTETLSHAIADCKQLYGIYLGKLDLMLSGFLDRKHPGATLPENWKYAFYRFYAEREEHLPDWVNDLARSVPDTGQSNFPQVLANQKLDSLLKTLALLLMCEGHIDSNLKKRLNNSWSKTNGKQIIKFIGEGVFIISMKYDIKGTFKKNKNNKENIEVKTQKIKDDSLTNVLAFATLFFSSVYFVVRTAVGQAEIKADYSYFGNDIKAYLPVLNKTNCVDYCLVLKP